MHILLETPDGRVPVWVNRPALDVIVHRKDRSGTPERFVLRGMLGDGRLVYVPAVPVLVSSSG
jgi:hypothetical protein